MSKKSVTAKFEVIGMHCSACEILIEKDVSSMDGVKSANASLEEHILEITAKNLKSIPTVDELNKKFSDTAYEFRKLDTGKNSLLKRTPKYSLSEIIKTGLTASILIVLFIYSEKAGWLTLFSLNGGSSAPAYFFFGVAAGLSSCAALVGGLLLSMSKRWIASSSRGGAYTPFILFNTGRIISFALLGGLLGALGSFFSISIELSAVLSIVVVVIMAILGLQMIGVPWVRNIKIQMPKSLGKKITSNTSTSKFAPFAIGASTFFLPCGFTLVAQSNVLTSGSFLVGSVAMLAFALGTLPMLALISFSSVRLFSNPHFARRFNLFVGILVILFALYTLNSQLNVLGLKSLSDLGSSEELPSGSDISPILSADGFQLLQMEATNFEYSPKLSRIKVGIPTRWEVYNSGAYGCASALYARGLYPSVIYLKGGLNTVEFTPQNKGVYKVSCSMGMVPPVTVIVE